MKDRSKRPDLPTRAERHGFLESQLRERTREWIVEMAIEELEGALGIGWYERGEGRLGYRKGFRRRGFTTSNGKHEMDFPRGFFFEPGPEGKKEWNSQIVPRYARRTEEVEGAVVMSYLCGTNTRRVQQALSPLLEGAALSRSNISRITARLSRHHEAWRQKDLTQDDIAILFLDGFNLKIRIGGKVEPFPVLCAIGVRTDGTKVLLALELRTSESTAAWNSLTQGLCARGVKQPVLALIDGNEGLRNAVKTTWPWVEVQRCTTHKLRNLYAHAPKRRHDEIKGDYHAIVYAGSEKKARAAWRRFERKWEKACPGVVKSLREGGDELVTFYRYPKAMWKCLRTTNCIERMNEEFRRRVKTQGSFPNSEAGPRLIFGLIASGLVRLRRIDGWKELRKVVDSKRREMGLSKVLDKAA